MYKGITTQHVINGIAEMTMNQGKIINELVKPKEKRGEGGAGPEENHINNILGRVYRR